MAVEEGVGVSKREGLKQQENLPGRLLLPFSDTGVRGYWGRGS